MRSVSGTSSVRLYYLDEGAGGARALFYGPLAEAMTLAARQPDEVQADLFLQTENDMVPFLDLEEGQQAADSPSATKAAAERSTRHASAGDKRTAPPLEDAAMTDNIDDPDAPALPWTTPPTDLGSATCEWCGRDIYAPAVPCSVAPVDGLAGMATSPGMGERCQWELRTREMADDRAAPSNKTAPRMLGVAFSGILVGLASSAASCVCSIRDHRRLALNITRGASLLDPGILADDTSADDMS